MNWRDLVEQAKSEEEKKRLMAEALSNMDTGFGGSSLPDILTQSLLAEPTPPRQLEFRAETNDFVRPELIPPSEYDAWSQNFDKQFAPSDQRSIFEPIINAIGRDRLVNIGSTALDYLPPVGGISKFLDFINPKSKETLSEGLARSLVNFGESTTTPKAMGDLALMSAVPPLLFANVNPETGDVYSPALDMVKSFGGGLEKVGKGTLAGEWGNVGTGLGEAGTSGAMLAGLGRHYIPKVGEIATPAYGWMKKFYPEITADLATKLAEERGSFSNKPPETPSEIAQTSPETIISTDTGPLTEQFNQVGSPPNKIEQTPSTNIETTPLSGAFDVESAEALNPVKALEDARRVTGPVKKESKGLWNLTKKGVEKAQTLVTSEFTPLRNLEKNVEGFYGLRNRGKEFWQGKTDLARKFEQVAGAPAKAEADIIDFKKNVTDPIRKKSDDFNIYLFLKRTESRLLDDPKRKKVGDWTVEKARAALDEMRRDVGDETFALFDKQGQAFQTEMDKALRLQVDSGRMSEELYQNIKKSNDFYAPFKVMKYLEEGEAVGRGSGRNVATTQALSKKITGIESEDFQIGNILQAGAEQIYRSRILAEKNMKMQELAKLADVDTEGKYIKKMTLDETPTVERLNRSIEKIDENISQRDAITNEISDLEAQLKSIRSQAVPTRQQAREGAREAVNIEVGKSKIETELPNPPTARLGKMQTPAMRKFWKSEIDKVKTLITKEEQVPSEYNATLNELKTHIYEELSQPDILAEVRKFGGLSIDRETALKVELKKLSLRELGRGDIIRKNGLTLDEMRERLADSEIIPNDMALGDLATLIENKARYGRPEFNDADLKLVDKILSGKIVSKQQATRLSKIVDWVKERESELSFQTDQELSVGDTKADLENQKNAFVKEAKVPVAAKPIYDRIQKLKQKLSDYADVAGETEVKLFDEIKEMVKNKNMTIREARDLLKRSEGMLAAEKVDRTNYEAKVKKGQEIKSAERQLRSKKYRGLEERRARIADYLDRVERGDIIIKDKTPAPAGWDKVPYLENGNAVALMVPREIATAVRGLTPAEMSLTRKVMQTAAAPFRWGATGANAGFQVVNLLFADLPRSVLVSKFGVRNPIDLVRFPLDFTYSLFTSLRGNFGKPNSLYMDWLKSGAANSTIQRSITPDVFKKTLGLKEKSGLWGLAKDTAKLPKTLLLDNVAKFSNAIEETNKILGLKRGMRIEGIDKLTPEKAQEKMADIVTEVRNFTGSPDFARHGALAKELNLLFMFLNARVQGISSDVARFTGFTGIKPALTTWARMGTAIGIPTLTLMLHNLSDENKNDYYSVPEQERMRYWMLPRYDENGNPKYFEANDGNKIREYYRIPKREIVQISANMIEGAVTYAQDNDPAALKRYAVDFMENISPVNIEGKNIEQRVESVIGSMNPLIKVPVEYGTGRNTFFHSDTVPQSLSKASPYLQYKKTTPELYKWLGNKFAKINPETGEKTGGISPLKIEQAVQGITAGGLNQFTTGMAESGRPSWVKWPVVKRFVRSAQLENKGEENSINTALTQQEDQNVIRRHKIDDWISGIENLKPQDKKAQLIELYKADKDFAKKVLDRLEERAVGITYRDKQIAQLEVKNGARAKYIAERMNTMTKDDAKNWLIALHNKGLLSDEVFDQVVYLKTRYARAQKEAYNDGR